MADNQTPNIDAIIEEINTCTSQFDWVGILIKIQETYGLNKDEITLLREKLLEKANEVFAADKKTKDDYIKKIENITSKERDEALTTFKKRIDSLIEKCGDDEYGQTLKTLLESVLSGVDQAGRISPDIEMTEILKLVLEDLKNKNPQNITNMEVTTFDDKNLIEHLSEAAREAQKKQEFQIRIHNSARIRAEKEEEERKARLEADFRRAWNATSSLDYFKQTIASRVPEEDFEKNLNTLMATTFQNQNTLDKIYTTLETALTGNNKFTDKQKEAILRIAQNGDAVATEKATSRWAHISHLSADPSTVVLSGIEPDEIRTFSAHDYIKDNIENNEIFKAFVTEEQRNELLKINDHVTAGKDFRLAFETLMAQSSVQFTPATKDAVLDFVGRAEELDKYRIELEQQRQAEEAKRQAEEKERQAEEAEKQRDEENRFLYSYSAADYIMRCLTDNQDLKDALNLTDSQRDTVIDTVFDVGAARSLTTTSTDFSEDFIEKLKEKDKSLTDEQLDILTDLAKRANEVEKRVLEEEAEAEAKNNEYRNLSDELYKSTNFNEYLASIKPLLDAESLKNAMALKQPTGGNAQYDACAKALDNPDWLIALKETYKKDWMSLTDAKLPKDRKNTWQKIGIKAEEWIHRGKTTRSQLSKDGKIEQNCVKEDIDGIILARLNLLTPGDITPENAFAWLHLAAGISDSVLAQKINKMVGEALYKYDQEHFGDKSEKVLTANYDDFSKRIQDVIDNDKNAKEIIGEYYITNDKDGPLSDKKEEQIKKSLLELAAELVAEDYAKYPPLGSDEEKAIAIKYAIKNKLGEITHYQKRFTQNEAIGILGANMVKAETFKNRIKTKFKNSTLYNNVNDRLTKLDKKLTKQYGKKYLMAKKITKFVAKTGWNVTKGASMFLVANAVAPGVGPAALIAYNTSKQWKSVQKQLSDPSISKTEKYTILIGTGLMTLASAATAATGAIPALDKLGLSTPEALQNLSNTMSTLTGRITRVGVITLGNTLPNMAKELGLRIKTKALEMRIKAQSEQLKNDPTSTEELKLMQELIKQHQELQKQKAQNKQEILEKVASAALGSFIGTIFGDKINKLFHGGENTTNQEAPQSKIIEPAAPDNSNNDTLDNNAENNSLFSSFSSWVQEKFSDIFGSDEPKPQDETPKNPTGTEGKPAGTEGKPTGTEGKPAGTEESNSENLKASKVEGSSGHGNMSAHQDTVRHLTNLGDSRFEDINATAQHLSEHLGDKTNIAVIACRMAPTDVYNALGLSGSDTPMTTHAMIDHLANHDLTPEQQTNLNNMLQEKFADWYNHAETHGVAPTSADNAHQTEAGDKSAAEGSKPGENKSNTSTANAAATATTAAAATDQASATTKPGTPQPTGNEFHKMNVPPTGNITVDALNAKFAVTNGLEGDAKLSIKFEQLTPEEAARLGLNQPQGTHPINQQSAPAEPNGTAQHPHPKGDIHRQDDLPVEAAIPLVYGSAEWAVQQGYIYDPQLSMGLNYGGTINDNGTLNNSGYAGAYVNPLSGKVLFIPNNPIEDPDLVQEQYINVAKDMQKIHNGPYARSNTLFGSLNTIIYGSGHIQNASTAEAKIMATMAMGGAIFENVRNILGHHKGC